MITSERRVNEVSPAWAYQDLEKLQSFLLMRKQSTANKAEAPLPAWQVKDIEKLQSLLAKKRLAKQCEEAKKVAELKKAQAFYANLLNQVTSTQNGALPC